MSKRYSVRPSVLLAVEDDYGAYCLDEACMYIMCRIEEEGKLPTELERLAQPGSNQKTVDELSALKGVKKIDYRRNSRGISDAFDE